MSPTFKVKCGGVGNWWWCQRRWRRIIKSDEPWLVGSLRRIVCYYFTSRTLQLSQDEDIWRKIRILVLVNLMYSIAVAYSHKVATLLPLLQGNTTLLRFYTIHDHPKTNLVIVWFDLTIHWNSNLTFISRYLWRQHCQYHQCSFDFLCNAPGGQNSLLQGIISRFRRFATFFFVAMLFPTWICSRCW